MRVNVGDEEIMRHGKKSSKRPPTKAKHQHDYQSCVFEYVGIKYDKAKGFVPGAVEYMLGARCSICGKIGENGHSWYRWVPMKPGCPAGRHEPTAEANIQLNPKTRTLPTHHLDDRWSQKYVSL